MLVTISLSWCRMNCAFLPAEAPNSGAKAEAMRSRLPCLKLPFFPISPPSRRAVSSLAHHALALKCWLPTTS